MKIKRLIPLIAFGELILLFPGPRFLTIDKNYYKCNPEFLFVCLNKKAPLGEPCGLSIEPSKPILSIIFYNYLTE
jgi:hypothetical protein